jgi:hypothetical protein
VTELTLADGVALVRQVLAESTVPPRWPMYLRQMKQFLRNARPDFDERRYGSLQDLLRACQKAGLVRLERDRQGGLRAFAGAVKSYMPQGWVAPESETAADVQEASSAAVDGVVVTEGDVTATGSMHALDHESDESVGQTADEASASEGSASVVEGSNASRSADGPRDETDEAEGDDQLAMFGVVRPEDPEPVKTRRPRSRKAAGSASGEKPKRARKAAPTRTSSRRSRT